MSGTVKGILVTGGEVVGAWVSGGEGEAGMVVAGLEKGKEVSSKRTCLDT